MKIVCSMGPNFEDFSLIDDFANEGMDIMRFNFSHADYNRIKDQLSYVRKRYSHIKSLQDLQGNKIRVSNLFNNEIRVYQNDEVYFCSERFFKNNKHNKDCVMIPLAFNGKFRSSYGTKKVLMKDATVEFEVVGTGKDNREFIKTIVKRGGIIRGEKGVNIPGIDRRNMTLTDKDKKDIKWGLENGIDIICLSYVTKARDMIELRNYTERLVEKNRQFHMPKLWAKIECNDGVKNFTEILEKSDGIMLGRGDLFAEVETIDIPLVQDKLMKIMKKCDKDFIIATYVLESMKRNMIPTITEVNDIYNFINGKVSGFMLSGEVSIGRYPLLTLKTMKSLIDRYAE